MKVDHCCWSAGWLAMAGAALAQVADPTLEASRAGARRRDGDGRRHRAAALRVADQPARRGELRSGEFRRGEGKSLAAARSAAVRRRHEGDDTGTAEASAAPKLLEIFDREIFGRIPAHTPKVTWAVDETLHREFRRRAGGDAEADRPCRQQRRSSDQCRHQGQYLVRESATGKHVPAMMALTFLRPFILPNGQTFPADPHPDWKDQAAAKGWAAIAYDNTSTQPDNGAGLHAGIIGLINKGGPRKPDDWGALQAWGWGASRVLDYLQTDPDIDAKRVAIMGHSRNGKAALVTMAHDPRFAHRVHFLVGGGRRRASSPLLWRDHRQHRESQPVPLDGAELPENMPRRERPPMTCRWIPTS